MPEGGRCGRGRRLIGRAGAHAWRAAGPAAAANPGASRLWTTRAGPGGGGGGPALQARQARPPAAGSLGLARAHAAQAGVGAAQDAEARLRAQAAGRHEEVGWCRCALGCVSAAPARAACWRLPAPAPARPRPCNRQPAERAPRGSPEACPCQRCHAACRGGRAAEAGGGGGEQRAGRSQAAAPLRAPAAARWPLLLLPHAGRCCCCRCCCRGGHLLPQAAAAGCCRRRCRRRCRGGASPLDDELHLGQVRVQLLPQAPRRVLFASNVAVAHEPALAGLQLALALLRGAGAVAGAS